MGNCLKPLMRSGVLYEEDKAEETKALVISTVQDQVANSSEDCCKKRKKVRFMAEVDNAEAAETTMRPPRLNRSVRVKVVITQSELKQILNQTTVYHHHPPPLSYSFDKVSDQISMVNCKRSRRSLVMCRCKCSWNPALQTIPECGHY